MKSVMNISLLICLVCSLASFSCSASGSKFVGNWKAAKIVRDGCGIRQHLVIKKRGDMYFVENTGRQINQSGMRCFDNISMSYKDGCLSDKKGLFTACFEGSQLVFTAGNHGEYIYEKE